MAIARAFVIGPSIILADQATAALDSTRAGIVMDLLRKLAAEEYNCIVAVSHDEKIDNRFGRLFHLCDDRPEEQKGIKT